MSVRIRDNNNIPKVLKALQELKRLHVQVGIFGEDDSGDEPSMVMIARVHEFGMTIKPNTSKYLTIPAHPKAHGKSAGEFKDLFYLETEDGSRMLAREKGKDQIEVYFVLVKSVTIPERSFMRSTYDEQESDIVKMQEDLMQQVIDLKMSPKNAMDRIGSWLASQVQNKIRSIKQPANANVTKEAKNDSQSNPLVDTGSMIQRITWKVVRE